METLKADDQSTLTRLLKEEVSCAESLLQFLQEESARLASDTTFVDLESASKLALINALQQASESRMKFAADQNLPQGLKLPKGTLSGLDSEVSLQSLYTRLATLAQQCFEENRRTGVLINRRTQFLSQVLNSLAPGSRNPQAVIYEEDGNTSSDPRNNRVDLARI